MSFAPSRRQRGTRTDLSPTVVALDGPFTHEHIHTRGIRLHAATAGDPADPLILLLHGSFAGWFEYRGVIAPLAEAGYHVAAVDTRGYGMSDKPPTSYGYDIANAVGDVSGLIRALGHGSAVVVGSDTGGTVAWTLAASEPERVRALVAVGAAHPVDLRRAIAGRPWLYPWLLTRSLLWRLPSSGISLLRRWTPELYRRQLRLNTAGTFHRSRSFTEELRLRLTASRISNTGPAIVHNNRLLLTSLPSAWLRKLVAAPTLLLYQEQGAWPHLARRSRDRVAPDTAVEQVAVPESRNLPHLENPAGFVAAILDFLSRELSPGD